MHKLSWNLLSPFPLPRQNKYSAKITRYTVCFQRVVVLNIDDGFFSIGLNQTKKRCCKYDFCRIYFTVQTKILSGTDMDISIISIILSGRKTSGNEEVQNFVFKLSSSYCWLYLIYNEHLPIKSAKHLLTVYTKKKFSTVL